jgi:hypothetical protein
LGGAVFKKGLFIYNDYKEQDYLENLGKIKGSRFIVNNEYPEKRTVDLLKKNCIEVYFKVNICWDWWEDLKHAKDRGFDYVAIDGENYSKMVVYSLELGQGVRECIEKLGFKGCILLPEDLGGEKYKDYSKFIMGLMPDEVLMERTYLTWKPWEFIKFIKRNTWYSKPYVGIWPEEMCPVFRWLQKFFVNIISGDRIFWYAETKTAPRIKR